MKKRRSKSKILALMSSFALVVFITACTDNTDTTTSSADTSAVANNDTTAMNNASVTDTGTVATSPSGETTVKKQTSTKKGRASVGVMTASKTTSIKADKMGVYEMTEVRPAFPGGQSALEDYITNNIEYPQMAVDDSKEGTVNVQFIIDENGKVTNAKLVGADLGDGLGDEAVRVVSRMPKWEPGKVKGKNVKTRLTLPVTYKLEE